MRYNNSATGEEIYEQQRRAVRNPNISSQYPISSCSHPSRNPSCKTEQKDDSGGSNSVQPKPYIARKVAAGQTGAGTWF